MSLSGYALSPSIAAGGMGAVHLAVAPRSSVPLLAVKRVHRHLAADPSFARMLAGEAGLASRIRHENAVATYGTDLIGDELVMVMEYVHGLTLRNLGELCRSPIPPRIAGAVVAGALRGLHAAHEAVDANGNRMRIVHCDVSPQNILVGVDGRPRIIDFGVAKVEQRQGSGRRGEVHCKIAYAAPEQLTGDGCDRRTDVYAASVVLWESLVGRPLFSAQGERHVVAQVIAANITRPRHLVPEIPRGLDAIVMRGIHPCPQNRFSSALEMATAIDSVFASAPVGAKEIALWMESVEGADSLLRARSALVSELRRQSRRSQSPRTLVSNVAHTRKRFSLMAFLSAEPRALYGLYGLVFAGAVVGGLIGVRALSDVGTRDDQALGTQHQR